MTSDLIARWLDTLAELPRGQGAARSLAGPRGVGKSHTLTAFSALVAFPEMRSVVTDAHVATSARRLMSRRYMIVRIERGTRPTLLEEMAAAFSAAFGTDEKEWEGNPTTLLTNAVYYAKGDTLVLIIDTAFGRKERVQRDDGPILGELALAARNVSAFIGLALDDDITDASGPNVALARTFQIDYLDPEHLYHVADIYLLRKTTFARAALHGIYLNLRNTVPGFNWSEPRFAALYPMHPLIADTTAAVRLHMPHFAFLPFAATAALRAVNRPAASLVLLDELFDHIEDDLRRSKDLREAFAIYDELTAKAVPQLPARNRLHARLILKSLFILSLDGRGATARELCAALIFSDESAPHAAVERVEEMLARLAESVPPSAMQRSEDSGGTRYRFQISAAASFDDALAASVKQVAADRARLDELLHSFARARFDDWPLHDENGETVPAADFYITWRGSLRRGRIVRNFIGGPPASLANSVQYEWEVVTLVSDAEADLSGGFENDRQESGEPARAPVSILWQPAELKTEEITTLRRLLALGRDTTLIAKFGATARAAASSLNAQAERIWARTHVDDAVLIIEGVYHSFTNEARSSATLAAALEQTFAPLFDERYPHHPHFAEPLGENSVVHLIDNFFSGAKTAEPSVQQLANLFAAPLGVATVRGDFYTFETGEEALQYPWIREVLGLVDLAGSEIVPLEDVHRALHREPYGLTREAQHLILAGLVAQRRIELVTSAGNRVSYRTSKRSIQWENISGISRAATIFHSAEELTGWARRLSDHPELASIASPEGRESVRTALSEWLETWRAQQFFKDLDALPDEALTLRVWNMAATVRKRFGASVDAVEAVLIDGVSLEEGLQRVADAFLDSPETYTQTLQQLADLTEFTAHIEERERAHVYLSSTEPTAVNEIDSARRELLLIAEDVHSLFDREQRERFDLLWREFQARYTEHYARLHDKAVGTAIDRRNLDAILRSDQWREFEALSQLPFINRQLWDQAEALLDHVRNARCDLPVRTLLVERPVCLCSFRLAHAASFINSVERLNEIMELGRTVYRRTLTVVSSHLAHALESFARQEENAGEKASRAQALSAAFAQGMLPALFTESDVRLMAQATEMIPAPPPVRVHLPTEDSGLLTRDELFARFQQWFEALPNKPTLIEIVSESESSSPTSNTSEVRG